MVKVVIGILIGALLTSTAIYLFNIFSNQNFSTSLSAPKSTAAPSSPRPSISPASSPSPIPSEVLGYSTFLLYIKNLGFNVNSSNKAFSDIYSGDITEVTIGEDLVYVIEYPTEMEALQRSGEISPDAAFLQKTLPDGSKQIVNFTQANIPTHYYKKGKIIVIYAGENESMVKTLEKAFGLQFAGHN